MMSSLGLGGLALSSTSYPPPLPGTTTTTSSFTTPFLGIPPPGPSLKRNKTTSTIPNAVPSVVATDPSVSEEDLTASSKIGSRVRVKVPLKVYHIPKLPEMDLKGKEGFVKQYVGIWKGKQVSANLPFKVEFEAEVEGRGKIKFFAHLRDDEFEIIG